MIDRFGIAGGGDSLMTGARRVRVVVCRLLVAEAPRDVFRLIRRFAYLLTHGRDDSEWCIQMWGTGAMIGSLYGRLPPSVFRCKYKSVRQALARGTDFS